MKVSVVVPCYNEEGKIEACISSLRSQKPDEIIVVDDGSADKTRQLLRKIEGITLIELEKNRGPAYARNVGWKKAAGDIIVFRDADSPASPTFIVTVRGEFERTNADVIEFPVEPLVRENASIIEKSIFYKEAILGGNRELIAKKSALEAVGGFDPNLGFGEDRELAVKYRKLNIAKSAEKIQVYISRVSGLREHMQRQLWYGRTMLAYILKTGDKGVLISYMFSMLLVLSLALAFIPLFLVLLLLLVLVLVARTLKISYRVYRTHRFWQAFFILPALEIVGRVFMGVGAIYGVILRLSGRYYVGR